MFGNEQWFCENEHLYLTITGTGQYFGNPMVTFIIYAVGLRILWEMAKWNVRMLNEVQGNFRCALLTLLSFLGWILLVIFIAQH